MDRHLRDYLLIAEQVHSLQHQKQALEELVTLNKRFCYDDQVRVLAASLKRVDELLEKKREEALSVLLF
jgi:hypothetical protein